MVKAETALRVGIVGAGAIAQVSHFPAFSRIPGVKVTAVCDVDRAKAERVASRYNVPRITDSFEELATMDLSRCDLAVLSACEANVGVTRPGLGVKSLQAAIHAAGVRTTITSLWRVSDFWTRELMSDFYRRLWAEKKTAPEALWEAKMAIRDRGAPLHAWGAWILTQ